MRLSYQSMRMVYWNTGLAPHRGKPQRDHDDVLARVQAMFADGIELIVLGEIKSEPFKELADALSCESVEIFDRAAKWNFWNMGVLHSSSVRVHKLSPVTRVDKKATLKVSFPIKVEKPNSLEFRLYLLHWRSRCRREGDREREIAAQELWPAIRRELDLDQAVAVMGDFNDEPFDKALGWLNASRDPSHVLENPGSRMYNPCWHLASPAQVNPWAPFGSYEHDADLSSQVLLDQALFSHHFLDRKSGKIPTVGLRREKGERDHAPLEISI